MLNTLYVFGEGSTETAFLKYIKSIYSRNRNLSVKIKNLYGGCPENMINKTIRIIKGGNYEKKFILIDGDIEISPDYKAKAEQFDIEIIVVLPCIEGLFLIILGKNEQTVFNMTVENCKNKFHTNYLDRHRKLNYTEYRKIFSINLLEEKRKTIKILDRIILYMTNKA